MLFTHGENDHTDETIKTILSNPDEHLLNIVRLSKVCRVKIRFHNPESFYIRPRKRIENVTEYVFPDFFIKGDTLYYKLKREGISGYPIALDRIAAYEPVLSTVNKFTSYEHFRKKFDTFFITEKLIKELYAEKSSQTGDRYRPSDFKSISSAGKKALKMFLIRFKGVNCTDTESYSEQTYEGKTTYYITNYSYGGNSNSSRDVSVEHTMGAPLVHYSSEQTGGGHQRCGLLANRSTYLWLEDD
jgi:hypothetical protein